MYSLLPKKDVVLEFSLIPSIACMQNRLEQTLIVSAVMPTTPRAEHLWPKRKTALITGVLVPCMHAIFARCINCLLYSSMACGNKSRATQQLSLLYDTYFGKKIKNLIRHLFWEGGSSIIYITFYTQPIFILYVYS